MLTKTLTPIREQGVTAEAGFESKRVLDSGREAAIVCGKGEW